MEDLVEWRLMWCGRGACVLGRVGPGGILERGCSIRSVAGLGWVLDVGPG